MLCLSIDVTMGFTLCEVATLEEHLNFWNVIERLFIALSTLLLHIEI